MKLILKNKHHCSDEDWRYAIDHIEELVSKKELDDRINATLETMRRVTAGHRVALAWSGGKDSIALGFLANKLGVSRGVCVMSDFHYLSYIRWCAQNKPPYVDIVISDVHMDWLVKHPKMLFPKRAEEENKWSQIIQRDGVDAYCAKNNINMVLMGRRYADGNMVRKNANGDFVYERRGLSIYNAIADWAHEELLALFHYYNLELPECYSWKKGFRESGSVWPSRMPEDKSDITGWRETYENDPEMVLAVAPLFESGREFLKTIGEFK